MDNIPSEEMGRYTTHSLSFAILLMFSSWLVIMVGGNAIPSAELAYSLAFLSAPLAGLMRNRVW
jgi:hypothetical protein